MASPPAPFIPRTLSSALYSFCRRVRQALFAVMLSRAQETRVSCKLHGATWRPVLRAFFKACTQLRVVDFSVNCYTVSVERKPLSWLSWLPVLCQAWL